jgi:hypothetical protein
LSGFYLHGRWQTPWSFCFTLEWATSVVRGDFNQIRPLVSNKHTRKTFLAKAAAALAGFGLLGAARLSAKTDASVASSSTASGTSNTFTIRTDDRAVSRSADSV